MEKTKVLFVSQEITPFLPESEMSLIGRFLPQGIQEKGREIRTFMPKYGNISERRNNLHEVIRLSGMNLIINNIDRSLIIKVASIQTARMQVYFIDNEDYFHRKYTLNDENGVSFSDNDERIIFFARGVLETVRKLRWAPDIVHCHGWITSLVPLYLRKAFNDDPLFINSKIVYSVYNDNFDKALNKSFTSKLMIEGITQEDIAIINKPDYVNISKMAINMSDAVIIGSEKINPEVQKHINTLKKPILQYQKKEEYINAYSNFYDKIIAGSFVEC